MPWEGGQYRYTKGLLMAIARNYSMMSEGLELRASQLITNPWSLAEYKADFDMALQSIGRGRWTGAISSHEFRDYRSFGRLQRLIIAEILGINDYELERLGFHKIRQIRSYGYYLMCRHLNEES